MPGNSYDLLRGLRQTCSRTYTPRMEDRLQSPVVRHPAIRCDHVDFGCGSFGNGWNRSRTGDWYLLSDPELTCESGTPPPYPNLNRNFSANSFGALALNHHFSG